MKLSELIKPKVNRLKQLLSEDNFSTPGNRVLGVIRQSYRMSDETYSAITSVGNALNGGGVRTTNVLGSIEYSAKKFDDAYSQLVEQSEKLVAAAPPVDIDTTGKSLRALEAEGIAHHLDQICWAVQDNVNSLLLCCGEFLAKLLDLAEQYKIHASDDLYQELPQFTNNAAKPLFLAALDLQHLVRQATDSRKCEKLVVIQERIAPYICNRVTPWLQAVIADVGDKREELKKLQTDFNNHMEPLRDLINARRVYLNPHVCLENRWAKYYQSLRLYNKNLFDHINERYLYNDLECGGHDPQYIKSAPAANRSGLVNVTNEIMLSDVAVLKSELRRILAEGSAYRNIRIYSTQAQALTKQLSNCIQLSETIRQQLEQLDRDHDRFADQPDFLAGEHLDNAMSNLSAKVLDRANAFYLAVLTVLATLKDRLPKVG